MVKHSLSKWKNLGLAFKFSMLMSVLLLTFIILVNYGNSQFYYTSTPTYVMPYYFLPFLAIGSADLVSSSVLAKKRFINNAKSVLTVFLVISLLILGSFSHVISASYWNTRGWWSENSASTFLSDDAINMINSLYATTPKTPYETADFLPADQPFPSVDDTQFQKKIRYYTYEEHQLILLSGMRIPQKLSMSILFDAQSSEELSFLERIYPIRCIVADKNATSYITNQLDAGALIFGGENYDVYDLSNSLLREKSDETIESHLKAILHSLMETKRT